MLLCHKIFNFLSLGEKRKCDVLTRSVHTFPPTPSLDNPPHKSTFTKVRGQINKGKGNKGKNENITPSTPMKETNKWVEGVTGNQENNDFFSYYLCGFVDGEGCFSISYRYLQRCRVGIESRPSFSIAQKKSVENYRLLESIRDFFGDGGIRDDKKGCYKYETRSLHCISKRIIPFFQKYKLQSAKQKDFVIFSSICSRMVNKEHLDPSGLLCILEDSRSLNTSGTRRNPLDSLIAKVEKLVMRDRGKPPQPS